MKMVVARGQQERHSSAAFRWNPSRQRVRGKSRETENDRKREDSSGTIGNTLRWLTHYRYESWKFVYAYASERAEWVERSYDVDRSANSQRQ